MENFTAVSNQTWQNLPPAPGQPAEERTFATIEEATIWLKEKRCGGVIRHFDGTDVRIVERLPAG